MEFFNSRLGWGEVYTKREEAIHFSIGIGVRSTQQGKESFTSRLGCGEMDEIPEGTISLSFREMWIKWIFSMFLNITVKSKNDYLDLMKQTSVSPT
jgi:hypothetical protein